MAWRGPGRGCDHATVAGASYREAARVVAALGGMVVIEPLAQGLNGAYPLVTPADVERFVADELAEVDNVALLLDTFHLGMNGVDLSAALACRVPVGHVQIADVPGRGEPGSGTMNWSGFFTDLTTHGYRGVIGCEYRPTTTTAESFGWLSA